MLRPRARVPSAPPLLPAPRRHVLGDDVHRIRAGTPLVLARGTGFDDDASAQRLRDGLAERTGVHLAIESHADPSALGPHIALEIDPSIGVIDSPSLRAQAYRIDVDAARIRVRGGGRAGLRHGCETLLQLVDARGRVAGCRIDDHPDFALRGVMLDVSRGKVPKPASIEALIDLCARLKLNVLMLYTEHTYRFRRHPEIGRDDDPLDAETMRLLDAYAERQGVELVPCLQSLGHMQHVLRHPRYAPLAETDMGWTIAPTAEGTYPLIADLYAEYLPNFRSTRFNANCDEPWDLGRGQSAAAAEALGPGGLYLDHVQKIKRLAAQHGKRLMIWGDVVHAHPERIPEIDRGITLLDWWYEAEFDYDRVRVFRDNDLEFMVCPGTSAWNCLFPRVANSQANISGWADAGRRHGALGLINTDWGDHGHYNLQGNSYYAYAWGAQESWSGAAPQKDFDRAFSKLVFDDSKGAVARLYRALGAVHETGFEIFNGSPIQYLFFDDVERAYFVSACRAAPLRRSQKRLDALRPKIEALRGKTRLEPLALEELAYACDASRFALDKALLGLEYVAWRRAPASATAAARRRMAKRFDDLAQTQKGLGRRLRRLWMSRSRASNLEDTLRRIRRSVAGLRSAARKLRANRPSTPPAQEPITGKGALEEIRRSMRSA